MSKRARMSQFLLNAIAANDGACKREDLRLVEQILEIGAIQRELDGRLDALMRDHRGNAPYLRRCRAARKKKAKDFCKRKQDLLLQWWPGLERIDYHRRH